MEWVAIAVTIARDPAVHRMAGALRVRIPEVVGLLTLTLAEMTQHAPDGNIADVPDTLLETWASWHGKRGAFAAQFRAELSNEDGLVTAWEKYNGAAIRRAKAARERTRAWRAGNEPTHGSHNSTHTDTHNGAVPVCRTGQDRTVPDQTKSKLPLPRKAAERDGDAKFDALWALYPKRAGGNPKPAALKTYRARLAAGVTHDELAAGLVRYAAFCAATGKVGTEYVKQAATFFGPSDEAWAELWAIPAALRPRLPLGSVTEAAARVFEAEVNEADRYQAEARRIASAWAKEHPAEYETIVTAVKRPYEGKSGDWIKLAIQGELTQRCAKAAGFKSYNEWRAGASP